MNIYKIAHCEKRSDFDLRVPNPELNSENGNEYYNYIVFIKETNEIYTRGKFYGGNEYDDSEVKSLIGALSASLLELSDEVEENEYVVAETLTRFEESKADKSEVSAAMASAGSTNNIYKLFIVGSEDQKDKSTTYSNSNVYTESGSLYAIDFSTTSDSRLKDFVSDIKIDFDDIKSIPKKYYYWKDKSMGENLQIGTSAQELKKIYPECVNYDEVSDRYSVNYQKLSIIALAAIDKLHDEINELKSRIHD